MSTTASSGGSAGGIAPRTSADAVAAARDGGHRLDQPRPAVRRPRTARSATWIDDARRRARARAGPPLALRPDPRRPGRRGADRARAATTCRRRAGARRWRDERPAGPGRGPGGRAVPPRRRTASPRPAGAATRSATGRGPATRAATTSPTGSAGRTRRSGPGAHAFDGVDPALERRPARRLPRGAHAGRRRRAARCRRAAPRRSTRRPPPPRRSSSACGLDRGVAAGRRARAARSRTLRLGAGRRAARRRPPTTGSSSRPAAGCSRTSCSPASSERRLRTASITFRVDTRPRRLLRCRHTR